MIPNTSNWTKREWEEHQKSKKYWLKFRSFRHDSPIWFNPPTCKGCGTTAIELSIPDGGCGDPECCPQTEHAEWLCQNPNCSVLLE